MGQNRASPQGVAARIVIGFVTRLANIGILAAPRFAPLPILSRNARAFHHVAGSAQHCMMQYSISRFQR